MRGKRLLSMLIAANLLIGLSITGCSDKTDKKTGKIKDKIVYALNTSPTGVFNPLICDTRYDVKVNDIIYDPLLIINEDGSIQPCIAESYKISDNQKELTLNLNPKAKWHDDKPITAEDVAFTLYSMLDPNYTGGSAGELGNIIGAKSFTEGKTKSIKGIKVINDNTITISFEKIYSPSLNAILNLKPIPKHVWSKVPIKNWDKETKLLNNPIGSGAYKLNKFESGQYVELEAFNNYFNGKAKTNKIILKTTNPDTLQAEFKNGNVDIANVNDMSKSEVETLKKDGFDTTTYPDYMFQYMGFNLREKKFQDKKVRQAFMYAIDRKLLVDKLLEGNGEVINTPLLPTSWAYPKDVKLNEYNYNIEKAKSLLKEAGWSDKNNDGILENSKGEKFIAELKYPTGLKSREQTALIIQESLKKVGIDIKLSSMEFSTLMEQVVANHEFDLYLMGNTLSLDPNPKPFWSSKAASDKKGEQGWNIVSYKNPKVDTLLNKGLATINQDERKEVYAEFGKILNEDVPEAFLYVENNEIMYTAKLKEFKPSTFDEFNNIKNWYIEE